MFHIVSLHTYLQISWNTLHSYFTILSIAQTKCLYNTSHKQTQLFTYIKIGVRGNEQKLTKEDTKLNEMSPGAVRLQDTLNL